MPGIGTIRLSNFSNVDLQNSLTLELSEVTSGCISGSVAGGGMSKLHIQLSVASYTPDEFGLTFNGASDSMLSVRSISATQEAGVMDIRLSFNNAAAVPEPASSALALLGLAGLAARRRRKG